MRVPMASRAKKSLIFMNFRGLLHHISAYSANSCATFCGTHFQLMPARPYIRKAVFGLFALGLLVASASEVFAQDAIALRVRTVESNGQVLVTFALDGGLTDEMKAVVQSGLRTVFTYTVELKMKVPAWVDRTVATAVVSTSVDYDNLTRRHTVSQAKDGRVEQSFVVENPAQVAQMVTHFERLPLFDTKQLEANREYYVLVRADARPRSSAALWPWSGTASGIARFTFIPNN